VKRRILIGLGAAAGVYVILSAALFCAMSQPPEQFGAIAAHIPMPAFMILPFKPLWMSARGGSLSVGSHAPDFELPAVDHSAKVRLASVYRERPVVLVFGSYT